MSYSRHSHQRYANLSLLSLPHPYLIRLLGKQYVIQPLQQLLWRIADSYMIAVSTSVYLRQPPRTPSSSDLHTQHGITSKQIWSYSIGDHSVTLSVMAQEGQMTSVDNVALARLH